MQSRANYSPPHFPANREKYREFYGFAALALPQGPRNMEVSGKIERFETNRNREQSGKEQGIRFPDTQEA
jgi:hypothetical protein